MGEEEFKERFGSFQTPIVGLNKGIWCNEGRSELVDIVTSQNCARGGGKSKEEGGGQGKKEKLEMRNIYWEE